MYDVVTADTPSGIPADYEDVRLANYELVGQEVNQDANKNTGSQNVLSIHAPPATPPPKAKPKQEMNLPAVDGGMEAANTSETEIVNYDQLTYNIPEMFSEEICMATQTPQGYSSISHNR